MRFVVTVLCVFWAAAACAETRFASIDGGYLDLADWSGQPVLVVNTASECGFTYQYDGLQELYDTFRDRGLIVLAVPSDDFNQELGSAEEIKEFCEISFGLDMPMADITSVKGPDAHPFYRFVKDSTGFAPKWNFNKVLLNGRGEVVATWGAHTRPMSRPIIQRIERLLN